MRMLTIVSTVALGLSSGVAVAQSSGSNVRVQAGHFCAQNKCVRFSNDLKKVSIQGRKAVSVSSYGLRRGKVISGSQYRQIFKLALRQRGVNERGN